VDEGDLAGLLRQHAVRHLVPGAVIGVLREGAAVTACCGAADVTTGEPVTPGTRFSAGSLTKSMVATVIAGLAEAGRLSLDDTVAAHVPELPAEGWAGGATVRDLLANRSGLPLRAGLEFGFADRQDQDDGALARLVADAAASAPAGDFWSYTNVGWCVLGRVIETATGAAWEDAMRRHLFDRAGMRETAFVTRRVPSRRAAGHEVTSDGPVPVDPLTARAYGPAGTSAITTVTDLLRFAALHLEDPTLGVLRAVHADVPIYGWLDSWCLGWARFGWGGGQVWGWDGLIHGERSVLRILPRQQAAVALMTNGSTGRAMYRSLFAELMASLFAITVPPLRLDATPGAAGDLSRFAGVYAWPDRQVEVTATTNGLLITREEGQTEALPLDERTFLTDPADPDNPAVTFAAFDAAGRPRVLYDMLWGLPRRGGSPGARFREAEGSETKDSKAAAAGDSKAAAAGSGSACL
jgi:CubicO group peptidase (beta-lactamase class C family)